jgi:hypothetical protein
MNEAASKEYAFFKDAFEICSDKIYKAGIWDHHPYLITELENHFSNHYPDGHITVEYDEHGYDRYGKELSEFNLEDTIANNIAKLDNIEDIIGSVLDNLYKVPGPGQAPSSAYVHKEVILNEEESMNKFKHGI